MKLNKTDVAIIILYVFVGFLSRTSFHLGPNFEMVTALSVVSVLFLKNKKLAFAIPLAIMVLTDFAIGNSIIFLFTWTGMLIAPLSGTLFTQGKTHNAKRLTHSTQTPSPKSKFQTLSLVSASILANIVFFLWTNLGVVLTTTMYEKNIQGLMQSYINALPFFRNQLVSGIIFTPVIFFATATVIALSKYTLNLFERKLNIQSN